MALELEKKSSVTIHSIAQLAGVSAKTVSRVINNQRGVSEKTRAEISKIIEDYAYYPHTGARSMRGNTIMDTIGVTVPTDINLLPLSQKSFMWLFAELYRVFNGWGKFVCFDLNPFHDNPQADYARGLWQQRYGSCLVLGPLEYNDVVLKRIHASKHPYLALGRLDSLPEISYATIDCDTAAYITTKRLLARGHKRIALLMSFAGYQTGVERQRGYLRALAEAEIPPEESLIRCVRFGSGEIPNAVHRLLLDHSVTALIDSSCSENGWAIREGARQAGRVAGKDFEVIPWTYTKNVPVLTEACAQVWLPGREAAAEGIELFGEWVDGKRQGPIQVLYPPTLFDTVHSAEVVQTEAFAPVL